MKKIFLLAGLALGLAACSIGPTNQQQQAIEKANNRNVYEQKNDIEFKNYNQRQIISDNPTTILWCTSAFPQTGAPLFTVPIVGKLTSGNKRPFPTHQILYESSGTDELPGPDGMYGTSGEYRYGFSPSGVYEDFYGLATYCTTEPTVFQRDSTKIVLQTDDRLLAAQQQAQALLKQGKKDEATKVLTDAINAIGAK